jgi:hypothetical protein
VSDVGKDSDMAARHSENTRSHLSDKLQYLYKGLTSSDVLPLVREASSSFSDAFDSRTWVTIMSLKQQVRIVSLPVHE